MKKFPHVRIECPEDSPIGRLAKIYLDDVDISGYVRSLNLKMAVDSITTIHFEFMANVELPEGLRALVTASIEKDNEDVDELLKLTPPLLRPSKEGSPWK